MLWSLLTFSVYQKGNDPSVKLNVLIKLWWSLFDEVCAAGQLQLAHIVLWKSIRCHCYLLIVRLYLFLYVCVSIVTVLVALKNRTTPSCIENVDMMVFSHFLTSINSNIRRTSQNRGFISYDIHHTKGIWEFWNVTLKVQGISIIWTTGEMLVYFLILHIIKNTLNI